tara:strand:- start:467 stop:664 length:198 start_codon:yes stop_codon:yes gene_type:complete
MTPKGRFIIALIITSTICGVVLFTAIEVLVQGKVLTDNGREVMGNTISALIAIVSMIIGNNILKQ